MGLCMYGLDPHVAGKNREKLGGWLGFWACPLGGLMCLWAWVPRCRVYMIYSSTLPCVHMLYITTLPCVHMLYSSTLPCVHMLYSTTLPCVHMLYSTTLPCVHFIHFHVAVCTCYTAPRCRMYMSSAWFWQTLCCLGCYSCGSIGAHNLVLDERTRASKDHFILCRWCLDHYSCGSIGTHNLVLDERIRAPKDHFILCRWCREHLTMHPSTTTPVEVWISLHHCF